MISLLDVHKTYPIRSGVRKVLNGINFQVNPGEKVGVLGKNGAGKSTLIRLIGGVELPTKGLIHRGMSVSWPLAFGGAFQGSLTAIDNIKFICRVYNVPIEPVLNYVEEFSELGVYLKEPVKKFSSGMLARLAFGISLAIEFDCFLIDEIVAVGDAKFQEKSNIELFHKRKDRAMIMVSHQPEFIRMHCDRAAVLLNGKLYNFDNLDDAFNFYNAS